MGRKLGFMTSMFPWPSCREPKTNSFRATLPNSACNVDSTESCFTNSSVAESESFSTASQSSTEAVMRAMRSDRLFFDFGGSKAVKRAVESPFEGSEAVAVASEDPYRDFRVSMEEVVGANGGRVKDWVWLEEMLGWYLMVNGKKTHGFIIRAFVDLLLDIASSSSSSSSTTTTYLSCCDFEIEGRVEEGNG